MKFTKINHPPGDRMLGVRCGIHNHRAYIRIEFWSFSYRLTFKEE